MDKNYNSYLDLIKELNRYSRNYFKKAQEDYSTGRSIWEDPLQPSDDIKDFLKRRTDDQLKTILTDTKRLYLEERRLGQNTTDESMFDSLLQDTVRTYSGKYISSGRIMVPIESYYDEGIREIYHHCESSYCQMCKFHIEGKGPDELEPSDRIRSFLEDTSKEDQYEILEDVKKMYVADKAAGWDDKTKGWYMMDEKQFDILLQSTVLGHIEKDRIIVPENRYKKLNTYCEEYYKNMYESFRDHRPHLPLEPSDDIKDFLKDKSKEEREGIILDAKKLYLADKAAGSSVINENSFDTIIQTAVLGQVEKSRIVVPETKPAAENTAGLASKSPGIQTRQWAVEERARRNKDVYAKYDVNTGESSSVYASKYRKQGNGDLMSGLIKNMQQEQRNRTNIQKPVRQQQKTTKNTFKL